MPFLEALGTAVPPHAVPQSVVKKKAEEILVELAPDLTRHLKVFDTAGIRQRHFVRPIDWYLETHGWQERSAVYLESGLELGAQAAQRALDEAGVPASAVDGIIVVSTTGITTPSLDARLVNRLGLRADLHRIPVWGLGCGGGVAGLNLAADLARAHPTRRYLMVAVETCSLAFNAADLSVRAFVATTLFGDGAAAALVRGDALDGSRRLCSLRPGRSHMWPDSEDVMGWTVQDAGLSVVFSRRIPDIVATNLAPVVNDYLKEMKATDKHAQGQLRYPFHPGGVKVLEAYERSLDLPSHALDESRHVLAENGNMSSPTVLFVLQETLRRRALAPGESVLLAALGPGFAAELSLLEG